MVVRARPRSTILRSKRGEYYEFAPVGPLVLDTAGNLYGVSANLNTSGAVFKLTPSAGGQWTKPDLFDGEGCGPGPIAPGLLLDSAGNVYGACGGGHHGEVFEITP